MKIIHGKNLKYLPASHEDPQDPGAFKKILFTRKDITGGKIQMVNWAKLPKGKKFAPHYHEDMEEIFIIIKGIVKIKVGNKVELLKTGDCVLIPARSVHIMENVGEMEAQYIVIGNSTGRGGKTIRVGKKIRYAKSRRIFG